MKKSIIAKGIIASSLLYSNTVKAKKYNNKGYITSAYQWTIETEHAVFTGTCENMDDVNTEITAVSKGKKILKKNIVPIPLTKDASEVTEATYTWNVKTNNGHSSGITTSLEEAQNSIASFKSTDVLKSSITESLK